MSRLHAIFVIWILCWPVSTLFPEGSASQAAMAISKEQLVQSIVEKREAYLEKFADRGLLLKDIEHGSPVLRMENMGGRTETLENPPFFYDLARIKKEIGIRPDDSPRVQAGKIFEFVKKRRKHTHPLHENNELHNPPRFFSVYGCGFCDDAASNMALLAAHYGHEARTWWIEGHVTALVRHDGKWRVYDPDALGVIEHEGEVADMDAMVLMGSRGELAGFNEAFASTENNRVSKNYPDFEPDNPRMVFLPFEKRLFFENARMLTNDGHYLEDLNTREKFMKEYENRMANFVRIVPLNRVDLENGALTLEDYFPFAGVFVQLPFSLEQVQFEFLPSIMMESEFHFRADGKVKKAVVETEIKAAEIAVTGCENRYLDLSLGVNILEPYPSRRITVTGIDALLKHFNDARLITVHQYSLKNAGFDTDSARAIEAENLEIQLRGKPIMNSRNKK